MKNFDTGAITETALVQKHIRSFIIASRGPAYSGDRQ